MSEAGAALLEEVVAVAREMPAPSVERLASLLDQATTLTDALEAELVAVVVQPGSQERVRRLTQRWRDVGAGVPPVAVAWALRGAGASDAWLRAHERVDLVWTGPSTLSQGVYRTHQVLMDVIQGARRSLLVVTFAAYRIGSIREALRAAADREVDVVLVIETDEGPGGKLEYNALGQLVDGSDGVRVFEWPVATRPHDAERYGALHAKCALADDEVLFVSSANMTGHALTLNMELGVLIRGGAVPVQAGRHFEELMRRGILQRMA